MMRSASVQSAEVRVRVMKRLAHLLTAGATALLVACLAQAPAAAQSYEGWARFGDSRHDQPAVFYDTGDALLYAQRSLSARDAMRAAEARYPGSRALEVIPVPRSGQARAYLVRIIINGDRVFVRVDARSGAVSGPCRSAAQCGG